MVVYIKSCRLHIWCHLVRCELQNLHLWRREEFQNIWRPQQGRGGPVEKHSRRRDGRCHGANPSFLKIRESLCSVLCDADPRGPIQSDRWPPRHWRSAAEGSVNAPILQENASPYLTEANQKDCDLTCSFAPS